MSRRRPGAAGGTVPGNRGHRSPLGGYFAHAELLDKQQAVGVGPVLRELAVGDAQGVGPGEGDRSADSLGCRPGEAAGVGPVCLPPHDQVLVVEDRPDVKDEVQVGQDGVDTADPRVERVAAVDLIRSCAGYRCCVGGEVIGDDLVGDTEVAVSQVLPEACERGVG